MSAPVRRPPEHQVPPLERGDHLSRVEFERRYDAMPALKKAELIDGVVHLPSPVRVHQHGTPHAALLLWLTTYWVHTPGTSAADNTSIRLDRLDLNNVPQPDALLLIDPERGGQATVDQEGYLTGAPELVAEVAASSVSIDRNTKLQVYRRHGVREHVLWRVEDHAMDWFVQQGGTFAPLPVGADGILRSQVFPGLWLDATALLDQDLARVLAILRQGLASEEHAAFLVRLQQPSTH